MVKALSVASVDQVKRFLREVKRLIKDDNGDFEVADRDETQETLTKLGIMPERVEEEVLELTIENYSKGPEENKSRNGKNNSKIWVFGKMVCDIEIYIKFSLTQTKKFTKCICVSFHEARYPLQYPFR